MNDLDVPPDDAFVRTAIRGMQTPEHHPDFWDDLASLMDQAEGPFVDAGLDAALGAPREFEMPGSTPRSRHVHARPAHRAGSRRAAPLRAAPAPVRPASALPAASDAPPIPQPAPAPAARLAPAAQVHIAAPTAAIPAAAAASRSAFAEAEARAVGRTAAFVSRAADPVAKLKVEHDSATLPFSMRSAANVVLLTIALMAIVVAVFAGLSLVRQRSDGAGPAPRERPVDVADAVLEGILAPRANAH